MVFVENQVADPQGSGFFAPPSLAKPKCDPGRLIVSPNRTSAEQYPDIQQFPGLSVGHSRHP
jgi:hypothetical protein